MYLYFEDTTFSSLLLDEKKISRIVFTLKILSEKYRLALLVKNYSLDYYRFTDHRKFPPAELSTQLALIGEPKTWLFDWK